MDSGSDTGDSDARTDAGDAPSDVDADAGTPCTSYADCVSAHFKTVPADSDFAFSCDIDTHTCVQLTSNECPLVIGDYMETMGVPPIFVGAFAVIPPTDPTGDPSYQNYALAISEFTNAGGIPTGPAASSGYRMPVAVVCDYASDLSVAIPHLANDAHVTSLVAAFGSSTTLATAFSTYGYDTTAGEGGKGLFFVNPLLVDSNLTVLPRGNQLWHMLGLPSDLAPAYAAVLPRIEQYIRNNPPWNLGPTAPMRVAVVTGDATVLDDLAGAVEGAIRWNGGQSVANTGPTATFSAQSIAMSTLNGQVANDKQWESTFNTAVTNLFAFQPHVIISFGADEFVHLIQELELQYTNQPDGGIPALPFYLLGPFNADSAQLEAWIGANSASPPSVSAEERIAGINYASPTNSILKPYQLRFNAAYADGGASSASDNESNFYDAMYFVVDSLIGAGKPPLTGSDVGAGMKQIVNFNSGTPCDMGPGDAGFLCVSRALTTNMSVSLLGTLGPPTFDQYGARVSQGDVYCMQPVSGAQANYAYDVLQLGSNPDGGAQILEGTFPCYDNF
jgi:hypothetical protein